MDNLVYGVWIIVRSQPSNYNSPEEIQNRLGKFLFDTEGHVGKNLTSREKIIF